LKHGHNYIYQSLPRLLTLWFEFGTYFASNQIAHYSSELDAIYLNDGKVLKKEARGKREGIGNRGGLISF
jgi:hypothetical protein